MLDFCGGGFCGVLLGILAKMGIKTWCFDGQFVVGCVVNLDKKTATFVVGERGTGVRGLFFFEVPFGNLEPIEKRVYLGSPLQCFQRWRTVPFGRIMSPGEMPAGQLP